MAATPKLSWTNILTQVSASFDGLADKPSAEIVALNPTAHLGDPPPDQAVTVRDICDRVGAGASPPVATDPCHSASSGPADGPADWMSTLDIINGMAGLADEQRRRLAAQRVTHRGVVAKLQRDLGLTQERLVAVEGRAQALETGADLRLQRAQAEADAQVEEIRNEAETRVRTIQAEARGWILEAEERVKIAELRAATAEHWLARIDAAAKSLLLNGHMNPDRED